MFLGIEVESGAITEHFCHVNRQFDEFDVINLGFVMIFSAELVLRIAAERLEFFKNDVKWNLFDTLLVVTSVSEVIKISNHMPKTALALRTARLVHVTRGLRIMPVLTYFRTLRLMVESLSASMGAIFWTGTLVLTLLYLFALLLTSTVTQACESHSDLEYYGKLQTHFGSIGRTLLTLLEAVFGGTSWAEFSRPLSSLGRFYELLFIGFILVIELVVFNVITGVVVEGALGTAAKKPRSAHPGSDG